LHIPQLGTLTLFCFALSQPYTHQLFSVVTIHALNQPYMLSLFSVATIHAPPHLKGNAHALFCFALNQPYMHKLFYVAAIHAPPHLKGNTHALFCFALSLCRWWRLGTAAGRFRVIFV
jgi:hypothetical protein